MDKKSLLIETSLKLFYQDGIHAVGINHILAISGVAKKTLYNHFETKEALIQACVIERDKRFMNWLSQACQHAHSTSQFIEFFFNALDDWINNRVEALGEFRGCFFVNTSAEYSDLVNPIFQQCLQHKLKVKTYIENSLSAFTNDKGEYQQLTDQLILLKEGVINSAFIMQDKQAALKAKKIILGTKNSN